MRGLWPLAVCLAVGWAAGLSGGHGAEGPGQQSRPKRGSEDAEAKRLQQHLPGERAEGPAGLPPTQPWATSPDPAGDAGARSGTLGPGADPAGAPGRRLRMQNPLYPVTGRSSGAYAVGLVALLLLGVGIVGNLAVMCVVWHSYHLQSAWNSILAGLALCDFLLLFFCLPVVVAHELTGQRLLGDVSCRAVPFVEVASLGITTFSLCALGIDRFHVATSTLPKLRPVERCRSILAKVAVIWVGSMTLAVPELLLWQLAREPGTADACVMKPSAGLPESVYSLVLTYQHARMWWSFGCYFCLPVLFTVTCQLVTWRVRGPPGRPPEPGEQQRNGTVVGLTVVYALCTLPDHVCDVLLAYLSPGLARPTLGLLGLVQQFSAFAKAAGTPVLLLCVCRPLGQAFLDCCCCCCTECGRSPGPSGKLRAEMSGPIDFHKPRGSPSLLPLGTPC